jgi:hypothetical protein
VGKRAVVPRSARVGRNVRVDEGVRAADFPGRAIRSGTTVSPRARNRPGVVAVVEQVAGALGARAQR